MAVTLLQARTEVRALLDECAVDEDTRCWLYTGRLMTNGYSQVGRNKLGHRLTYEAFVGPIPAGLDIDHLCRVRNCVNPGHLEPVTRRENLLRGQTIAARKAAQTSCVNGHEFTEANTYRKLTTGTRVCRACGADRARRKRAECR